MFSRLKRQLPVFAPLGAGLLIITLLTALGGLWQYQHELDSQLSAKPAAVTAELTASRASAARTDTNAKAAATNGQTQAGTAGTSSGIVNLNAPAASNDSHSKTGSTGSAAGTSANGQPAPAAQTVISVALSVNGQAKGPVKLASGSTQCDVLSQALAEGVISSLDMRYSSQYGTEAVYVINGIGDPDTVWWTYTVNGSAPPYGCSYIAVHNGDSVNWQYVS